ncbi:hypothetical protein DWU98_11185 [Dyella monticola]|uniref:Uncharacterized protein n=1 Tax=Dyella monticola TaxID=1927958 RepID=A0A370WYN5_9GAMM|nr:hypothetical protein [Dyella monticola]RDS81107.1 hypothetical protein DWU98_11185 [Dyella monticola]
MNSSFILEMVAARASASGNTAVADVLARMRAQSGALSNEATQDLLAQLGQSNPLLSAFVKQMGESHATAPTREPVIIDAQEVETQVVSPTQSDVESPVDTMNDAVNALREHAQQMFAELQILRERSDSLASALGACCLCWGHDTDCRNCHGRGAPGFSLPHETQFEEFVLPAIRTLKAQMSAFEARARRVSEAPNA